MDGGSGHCNVQQVIGDDGGQPNKQQELPPLELHRLVNDLPISPSAAQESRNPVLSTSACTKGRIILQTAI